MRNNKKLARVSNVICFIVFICFSLLSYGINYNQYKPYGQLCSNEEIKEFKYKLKLNHIDIAYLGDDIGLTISKKDLFESRSNFLKNDSILDYVVKFLNCYSKMEVSIEVYSNEGNSPDEILAIASKQGERIRRYLGSAGLDARLLTSKGKMINSESFQRIEINFRRLP